MRYIHWCNVCEEINSETPTENSQSLFATNCFTIIVSGQRIASRETTAKQQTRIIRIDCLEGVVTSHVTCDERLTGPSNHWFSIRQHCRVGNFYKGWLTVKFWGRIRIMKNIAQFFTWLLLDKRSVFFIFVWNNCLLCHCVTCPAPSAPAWETDDILHLKWVHQIAEWRYLLLNSALHKLHRLGLGRYWHRVSNSNRYSVVSNSIEYRLILSLYSVSMPSNN